jgi:hypothetical protein
MFDFCQNFQKKISEICCISKYDFLEVFKTFGDTPFETIAQASFSENKKKFSGLK